jgi:archaetidylinositol phosphate synthase
MLYKKREYFDKLSKRIGIIFSRFPLSPNQWTLLGLLLTLITFYFLIENEFFIASIIFAFTAFIDIIDGAVAKVNNRVSVLGTYLDTITDRYVEFIIISGLFFIKYPSFIFSDKIWLFIILFGSFMTSYSISAAHEEGVEEIKLRGGILERAERMIFLFLIIILSTFSRTYALYLIVIMAILANITALQRIWIAICIFKKERK